ncbi:putative FMN-dependent luciferase-like monooxygenase [Leifsonia sp. TF02-11]|uniref:putative FMN-dependent luciferase-like monooxygenase n=1 Tax=Leifsonia sp. TF02-11 TaxID=2815212 RepID=UPI001AA19B4E|nr:putative FMN-dependent luciferase-like monooxygenase [Leifsonia sp. TF02-11]MBO1741190.1 putative FMN-dependent luciferase-like monooxygenase [Leifsonia sp. TF02-11]
MTGLAQRSEPTRQRLGFFTRLLDAGTALQRYRNALDQFVRAEEVGLDTVWVAQHHFHEAEGGLPSPFVLLAQAAALTSRIRLGTGIVTLPLEAPLRVAEDAAVLHLLSDGRLELGIGSGGTPSSFPPFGHDPADRAAIYDRHREALVSALRGEQLTSDGGALYPAAPAVLDVIWEATFSAEGAARIGRRGNGLMLSRTQPRREWQAPSSPELQEAIVDAYLAALPDGVAPRILASRSVLVVDTEAEAASWVRRGIDRGRSFVDAQGLAIPAGTTDAELLAWLDVHIGTPEQVLTTLGADTVLARATDVAFQPHPVDPPHETVLRSIELSAEVGRELLDWSPAVPAVALR